MDREKQIEEMAHEIRCLSYCEGYEDNRGCYIAPTCALCRSNRENNADQISKALYNAGYRKQSEGEWEKFEGERFICSNCAKVFGLGSTATIYDVKRVWKYCPNCGAKMKGGEE